MKFLQIDKSLAININAINSIEVKGDKVMVYWKELIGGDEWELAEAVYLRTLDREAAQEELEKLVAALNDDGIVRFG